MRSGDEVIGLPVVDISDGAQVGVVKKLIFNRAQDKLLGIVIDEGGWFKGAKIVPFEEISHLGENAITIEGREAITGVAEQAKLRAFVNANSSLKGKRLITAAGKELGSIDEVLINPHNGRVEAFRISDGLLYDLLAGKTVLPRPENFVWGEDTIIVPDEIAAAVRDAGDNEKAEQ